MAGDPVALERFRREAGAASALNHPNVCVIHEIGQHDGRPFIAMELMKGETLKHHIGDKPMEIEQSIDLAIQIAAGLDAAHSRVVVTECNWLLINHIRQSMRANVLPIRRPDHPHT
jgi:eukaryotic-like serine/threonine-protein kinase